MRQCPTLPGDQFPLIAHSIANGVCTQRQREFYHKCHRCVFRGKAADFVLEQAGASRRNGTARPLDVDLDLSPDAGVARETAPHADATRGPTR